MDKPKILTRAQRFAQCRPKTTTQCDIEAQLSRPNFQLEVRRYFWDKPLAPTFFEYPLCYLELSLNPRPSGTDINYLGGKQNNAFIASGNCSFIPAGHKVLVRCPQGEQRVLSCLFEMSVFESFVDWQWTPLELAACYNISSINIRNTLVLLAQETLQPDYKSNVLADAQFNYLLVELSRHIRAVRASASSTSGQLTTSQLRLIETCIANSSEAFPKTAWLAKQCGISARHLARIFKQTTGKTLTEYITEIRINKAKIKLLANQQKIKEIAYECGFQSPSAFTQAFKKATDYTPRQFRHLSQ